jgi:hypothetical protein
MEFQGGDPEDTETVWTFHCTLFFIAFSSLLIGFQPGMNAIGMGFMTYQWRGSFPVRRICRNVANQLLQWTEGLMGSYNCIRRVIVLSFVSPIFFLLYTGFGSPEGHWLKRGIM